MLFFHTTIVKDDRCVDLLLTEDEIVTAFQRSVDPKNQSYIDKNKCCDCWSIEKPPKCTFWSRIMGICKECDS